MFSPRRSLLAGVAFLSTMGFTNSATTALSLSPVDPLEMYGKRIEFSVLRDGDHVGRHNVIFNKTDDQLEVISNFELKLTLLGLPIYKYIYASVEKWERGKLTALSVDIVDGGERITNSAARKEAGFWVNGQQVSEKPDYSIYPTNHWNKNVLFQDTVLNTISGNLNRVTIQPEGIETIAVQQGLIEARRYQYVGDLDATVWYDRKGRWVKLAFTAKDGSNVEYFCLNCNTEDN
ncbi:DUF6134 family protein [Sneathiella sp.]|jgi:hypothetical protein|uniref:DUF6134 family protein n=1 Tax=Sneathiella sp. TaxID=1964365 RepID=UPI0039E33889